MKPVSDLKKGLIFGDIITDKENFFRFLHHNKNKITGKKETAQCEILKRVKCGKNSFAVISTYEEVTLSLEEIRKLYLY